MNNLSPKLRDKAIRPAVDLEIVTDFSRLIQLQPEWSGLVEQSDAATPFQFPEWLMTWWHHFGSGQLRVFFCRNIHGIVVGILPAFLHTWGQRRQLTLIGTGISDFLDPVFLPGYAEQALSNIATSLNEHADWDICSWQDLSAESAVTTFPSSNNLCVRCAPDTPCSEIPLTGSFEQFWSQRSHGLRRNVRRYREKAERISSSIQMQVSDGEPGACLGELIALHSERWRERGESGMIVTNRSGAFLHDVVPTFAKRRMAVMFSLQFSKQTVAIILALSYRRKLYAYLSAFDPAYASLGFGRLLLYEAIQYAFRHEFRAWCFLRGTEPYKYEWGAREIAKVRMTLHRCERPSL